MLTFQISSKVKEVYGPDSSKKEVDKMLVRSLKFLISLTSLSNFINQVSIKSASII